MAHQDVVPVPKVTEADWKYPPYSGHNDGENVWGRGSEDCKNNLMGILNALEFLLSQDFEPKRTILAGFGFDEEIS
jgi:Gly-Xaa carboxypeptidase